MAPLLAMRRLNALNKAKALRFVHLNHGFSITNDGLSIKDDELCIPTDGSPIKIDGLCIENDEFYI